MQPKIDGGGGRMQDAPIMNEESIKKRIETTETP